MQLFQPFFKTQEESLHAAITKWSEERVQNFPDFLGQVQKYVAETKTSPEDCLQAISEIESLKKEKRNLESKQKEDKNIISSLQAENQTLKNSLKLVDNDLKNAESKTAFRFGQQVGEANKKLSDAMDNNKQIVELNKQIVELNKTLQAKADKWDQYEKKLQTPHGRAADFENYTVEFLLQRLPAKFTSKYVGNEDHQADIEITVQPEGYTILVDPKFRTHRKDGCKTTVNLHEPKKLFKDAKASAGRAAILFTNVCAKANTTENSFYEVKEGIHFYYISKNDKEALLSAIIESYARMKMDDFKKNPWQESFGTLIMDTKETSQIQQAISIICQQKRVLFENIKVIRRAMEMVDKEIPTLQGNLVKNLEFLSKNSAVLLPLDYQTTLIADADVTTLRPMMSVERLEDKQAFSNHSTEDKRIITLEREQQRLLNGKENQEKKASKIESKRDKHATNQTNNIVLNEATIKFTQPPFLFVHPTRKQLEEQKKQ
jgi:hypothetical protein